MRAIALILVVLGAVGLGLPELADTGMKRMAAGGESTTVAGKAPDAIPSVMSGIALTSGLILMATGLRRR
jgi:hypothetical protein